MLLDVDLDDAALLETLRELLVQRERRALPRTIVGNHGMTAGHLLDVVEGHRLALLDLQLRGIEAAVTDRDGDVRAGRSRRNPQREHKGNGNGETGPTHDLLLLSCERRGRSLATRRLESPQ